MVQTITLTAVLATVADRLPITDQRSPNDQLGQRSAAITAAATVHLTNSSGE